MNFLRKKYCPAVAASILLVFSGNVQAIKFEPGIGVGAESTSNARLSENDKVSDVIAATYVGGNLTENEGALRYNAAGSLNKHNYTKGTFENQRYLNLTVGADWAMIENKFNWNLSNNFKQRPIISLNSNTPTNIQNTNVFTFGANVIERMSRRQSITITPLFSQYYYENLITDNRQLSLAANWNYQWHRLINLGLNASVRGIDYFESGLSDTSFSTLQLIISTTRKRSVLSTNLGSTNVKRDNGQETSGFTGNVNWLLDVSSRSQLKFFLSSELTDASSIAANVQDPTDGNDVQVSADVIRNSAALMSYIRDDATFKSLIWLKYNKQKYSDNPFDREVRSLGMNTRHPLSRMLAGKLYLTYQKSKQLQSDRLDKRFSIGANLNYKFTKKWHSLIDLKYRKKQSTNVAENFNEVSVFATLVYGFGGIYRPTRAGGF